MLEDRVSSLVVCMAGQALSSDLLVSVPYECLAHKHPHFVECSVPSGVQL